MVTGRRPLRKLHQGTHPRMTMTSGSTTSSLGLTATNFAIISVRCVGSGAIKVCATRMLIHPGLVYVEWS